MALNIDIEHVSDDDGTIRQKLLQLLIADNTRKAGVAKIDRSLLCIKDPETGEILGGIWTEILFDWMYIEILYVPDELRGQGLGLRLLQQAEAIAASKNCVGIWLETFEFQAPGFYQQNGYEVFATLDDYPRGSKRHFLQKQLQAFTE
ncbi:GNAT superfamily N-acetyltransferase [Ochrobactrum anthropi]|uniref:GNAT family N-acetyltransferase n=1 Tax=Brucella anthropi TaxID=529 RepID=UPI0015FCA3E2|nr:GNAT family N-acetyltransferase [Brucella anthropi]MBA8862740.1 GNAT superfamily N-acetyltransferase [Brucella anthropi]